jgi:hypothetical protein
MSPSLLYHIAAGLLLLFAAGHTLGFRTIDPSWGVAAPLESLKTMRFTVQGFSRTYWGFYTGFGMFVTVLLLLAAVVAWQLAGLAPEVLKSLPLVTWGLAASFVVVTYLSWRYFFMVPLLFSVLIALCLLYAAWSVSRTL